MEKTLHPQRFPPPSSPTAPSAATQSGEGAQGGPKTKGAKDVLERFMHLLFLLCGIVAVAFVLCISVYLIISGLPAIQEIGLGKFLLGQTWAPTAADPSYGILPFILTSVYGTAGAVLIGVPVGLMTAIYLAKVANPRMAAGHPHRRGAAGGHPLRGLRPGGHDRSGPRHPEGLRSFLRCLPAGGDPGAGDHDPALHHQRLGDGPAGCARRSMRRPPWPWVPPRLETVFRVTVPAARSGVATAIVLGVGRAIGEAMAIIMVAGNVANMPGLFQSVRFLTTAIASEMSYASVGSLQRQRPVFHRPGAVPVHHAHQRLPERVYQTKEGG